MENFKEQLSSDMKEAMRAKDTVRLTTIRSIINAITVAEKNGSGKEINHNDILSTMAKQRRQSIEAFDAAGNQMLANSERAELTIIESYMPKMMSDEELTFAVNDLIFEMDTQLTMKDMGRVMNEFKNKYPGQDMSKVSAIIKQKIA